MQFVVMNKQHRPFSIGQLLNLTSCTGMRALTDFLAVILCSSIAMGDFSGRTAELIPELDDSNTTWGDYPPRLPD